MANSLKANLYKGQENKIVLASDIRTLEHAEIEDIIPSSLFADVVDRYLRGNQDEDFSDTADATKPMAPQVKAYADKHGKTLDQGWKVEVSKKIKVRLLADKDPLAGDIATVDAWKKLFEVMQG